MIRQFIPSSTIISDVNHGTYSFCVGLLPGTIPLNRLEERQAFRGDVSREGGSGEGRDEDRGSVEKVQGQLHAGKPMRCDGPKMAGTCSATGPQGQEHRTGPTQGQEAILWSLQTSDRLRTTYNIELLLDI